MSKTKRTVFVLTREINDHNQEGEYFETVFAAKPDIKQLAEAMAGKDGMPNDVMEAVAFLEHLRAGGGRRASEDVWYNLDEVDLKAS